MSDATLQPGDLVLLAAKNGTVRHGTVLGWQTFPRPINGKTGSWFVEIDHDPTFGRKPNGFRSWFDAEQLIKVEVKQ